MKYTIFWIEDTSESPKDCQRLPIHPRCDARALALLCLPKFSQDQNVFSWCYWYISCSVIIATILYFCKRAISCKNETLDWWSIDLCIPFHSRTLNLKLVVLMLSSSFTTSPFHIITSWSLLFQMTHSIFPILSTSSQIQFVQYKYLMYFHSFSSVEYSTLTSQSHLAWELKKLGSIGSKWTLSCLFNCYSWFQSIYLIMSLLLLSTNPLGPYKISRAKLNLVLFYLR